MANNRDLMLRGLTNSPEFVKELFPAAERTALLYHLSYLCLGNFPKLERILRQRAVENQLLFVYSEALILKCATTSDDLVSSLLPMLKLSVEDDQPVLAVKSLEKSQTWINEIIQRANEMIDRYEKHIFDVASSTSDVITEKAETEKKKVEMSSEIKSLDKIVDLFQDDRKKISDKIEKIETKIKEKNAELQNHVSKVCRTSEGLGIMTAIVPFIGPIIETINDTGTAPGVKAKTKALTNELSQLTSEKSDLRNKDWSIQLQMTELQLKSAILKIEKGTIPDPVHLGDVQNCLSQIRTILIQLQKFWTSVGELLDSLKKKTFVGEDILDGNMTEITKSFFLKSIKTAEEYWKTFGQSCLNAKEIFDLKSKDAYKFLESSPPVDQVEWKQEYDSVIEKLKKINPDRLWEANQAAITE